MKGNKRHIIFICLILVAILVICFIYSDMSKGDKEDTKVIKVEVSDIESIEWNLFDNLFQDDWYYTVDFINKAVSYRYEGMGDEIIVVKFTDGSVHETYCSNEYPSTYD